jgi:hypothetical protein
LLNLFFHEFKTVFNDLTGYFDTQNIVEAETYDLAFIVIYKVFFLAFAGDIKTLKTLQQKDISLKRILKLGPPLKELENKFHHAHYFNTLSIKSDLFEKLQLLLASFTLHPEPAPSGSKQQYITPEEIGKTFEVLIDELSGQKLRSKTGIFYSPQAEIELICRLTLSRYIHQKISEKHHKLMTDFIFAKTSEKKNKADRQIFQNGLSAKIDNLLTNIKIIDPACGSGSFLLEMLFILEELKKRLKPDQTSQQIRTQIVINNLYGVDVLPWACYITCFRLWFAILNNNRIAIEDLPDLSSSILSTNTLDVSECGILHLKTCFKSVFKGSQKGFDIVIGNPPYVRQEFIEQNNKTSENKAFSTREYKQKLVKNIYQLFPDYFAGGAISTNQAVTISAKSDLYIYFYFTGLALLNSTGIMGYITSNSWLDVDFGKPLRQFLLKSTNLYYLIENSSTVSFSDADINTVISIFSAPKIDQNQDNNNIIKFISLKGPFQELLSSETIMTIDNTQTDLTTERYQVIVVKQHQLLNTPESVSWGGQYLRTPSIYRYILEKTSGKLIALEQLARIRFGIKSGVNQFFYLTENVINTYGIEKEFIKPFVYSFKEVEKFSISSKELSRRLFYCPLSKSELDKGGYTGALNYIMAGENEGYHLRPSVKTRPEWYNLPTPAENHFISNRFLGERFGFPVVENLMVSDVFFTGFIDSTDVLLTLALLNSTLSYLSTEILARKTYSIGVAYIYGSEIKKIKLPAPTLTDRTSATRLKSIFKKMQTRKILKIEEELRQPDRLELDSIIFKMLALSDIERDAIYESLIGSVKSRIQKAKQPENF